MPAFLAYCLNSPAGRDYSWRVKTDGVSQSIFNAKKLAAFQLPLPTVEEQQEIVQRIETAFAWLDRVAAEHANASRLLPNSTRPSWPRPSGANSCCPMASPVRWPMVNRRRRHLAERLPYQLNASRPSTRASIVFSHAVDCLVVGLTELADGPPKLPLVLPLCFPARWNSAVTHRPCSKTTFIFLYLMVVGATGIEPVTPTMST
jgi:hypothetical protein